LRYSREFGIYKLISRSYRSKFKLGSRVVIRALMFWPGRYGVSESAPGGGPLPGFLPIGVPAGAPPSGVNAPVIPVSGAPPVSGMHVVEGGRDMPGREGPPPSLGPTGPRMPHNVIPPFGLPSLPRECANLTPSSRNVKLALNYQLIRKLFSA
jgi:hypothetical protein